jgi:hypothetical protein
MLPRAAYSRTMRRVLFLCVVGGMLSLMAGPAGAQARDPFDPLVDPETAAPVADETGSFTVPDQDDPTTEPAPADPSDTDTAGNQAEGLPTTGAATDPWLVVAYGLIAAGLCSILVSKVMDNRPRSYVARADA